MKKEGGKGCQAESESKERVPPSSAVSREEEESNNTRATIGGKEELKSYSPVSG